MNSDLDRNTVERAYARWAPIYDAVFGPIFERGRREAASIACQTGGRILEVGVGTGLSFDHYDRTTEVIGIDLSMPMIARAQARVASGRYPQVRKLFVMDAHELAFADGSFDCAVAQFVITLVANPERVLSECARVVKVGGRIILVNHLYSERGLAAAFERWFARHARALGLRPEFPFARLAAWAKGHGGADLIERRQVPPFGVSLVVFRRSERQAVAA